MKLSLKTMALCFSVMLIGVSCSKQNFSSDVDAEVASLGAGVPLADPNPIDSGGGGIPVSCISDLRKINTPVKILFVVDTSGSNVPNAITPTTDQYKAKRFQAVNGVFSALADLPNFKWGFQIFQNSSSVSIISGGRSFADTRSEMQMSIDYFMDTVVDRGGTPYGAALDRAANTIANDTGRTATTKYIVIWISDGLPDPEVQKSVLLNKVSTILSKAPGQVSFSSVYYGPYNADAADRLSAMAKTGGGRFLDANLESGRDLDVNHIITIPGVNCGG